MQPIDFRHANRQLNGFPAHGYSDRVVAVDGLRVWTDGEQCVSLWKPSFRERLSILLFGRVWLAVLSGHTQPPVTVSGQRAYFIDPGSADAEITAAQREHAENRWLVERHERYPAGRAQWRHG